MKFTYTRPALWGFERELGLNSENEKTFVRKVPLKSPECGTKSAKVRDTSQRH